MAHKLFSAAVDITPEMAYKFVQVAKQMGIEFYVAPFEADAQLAYMWKSGRADVVITEDSDLLAFGVKKCFFKMDKLGQGFEICFLAWLNLHTGDECHHGLGSECGHFDRGAMVSPAIYKINSHDCFFIYSVLLVSASTD